ncbi:hypothetical protein MATR_22690 [Marivirga tractuosa]|uniref:Uncharacterized protein n=1 Tax=Marivirga tractuosa (strain ATCC 23168 / DSM 4126 / NBRC 15989 / NCIMB 1408 / VKM B-1430 / H-43) TaxID=643867 RepID=E4TVI6_MARTH|nr:DUF5367 domain-containing protein [Marivirga tractuosa]ADR20118.1 hypothetical protein Ftrac_0105 [Marivirga tractuosa DSM 4126]BDD15444.1 hypothetical protein MATR_22690 [Marivirga tractuosa]
MNYQKFSLLFGFSVWLIATLIFRVWGHSFFIIENSLLLTGFFLGTIPILFMLSMWVFNKFQLIGNKRLESATLMTIPGMLCDVACLKFHHLVFPKLTIEQSIVLGAWILWAYVIVLLIGVMKSRNKNGIER